MRDATGAAWVFGICLTFILIFSAYLAITVNYLRVFNMKNHIVDLIEEREGYSPAVEEEIVSYLSSNGYQSTGTCQEDISTGMVGERNWELIKRYTELTDDGRDNFCIYKLDADDPYDGMDVGQSYYRVTLFVKFDIPVVRYITSIKISGQTRIFYDFANKANRSY